MNKICGVYKIQSKIKPERIYIGSSLHVKLRWSTHKCALKSQRHCNSKLQYHYNKYGKGDLEYSLLEICDANNILEREQYYIDLFIPYFNVCAVAGTITGFHQSKEQRANASERMIGNTHVAGHVRTDEWRSNIGKSRKGHSVSEETRQKLRDANLGKKHKPESIAKMCIASKGRIPSTEQRRKMSVSNKGKTPWSKGKTGVYSESVLAQMRISARKRVEQQGKLRRIYNIYTRKYSMTNSILTPITITV